MQVRRLAFCNFCAIRVLIHVNVCVEEGMAAVHLVDEGRRGIEILAERLFGFESRQMH